MMDELFGATRPQNKTWSIILLAVITSCSFCSIIIITAFLIRKKIIAARRDRQVVLDNINI